MGMPSGHSSSGAANCCASWKHLHARPLPPLHCRRGMTGLAPVKASEQGHGDEVRNFASPDQIRRKPGLVLRVSIGRALDGLLDENGALATLDVCPLTIASVSSRMCASVPSGRIARTMCTDSGTERANQPLQVFVHLPRLVTIIGIARIRLARSDASTRLAPVP